MTTDREAKATAIARELAGEILEMAPPTVWGWSRLGVMVDEVERAFLRALGEWERTGSAESWERTHQAAAAVLVAWRVAVKKYERAMQLRLLPA